MDKQNVFTAVYRDITTDEAGEIVNHPKWSAGSWSHALDARNEVIAALEAANARIAELEAAIRKQANAARSLADATIRDASIRQGLAEKAYAESSPEVLASERQANAMLTQENDRLTARLTALESERDALLAAAGKEAKPIYQVFMRGLKVFVDTTKEAYENNLKSCPEDARVVYTAPTTAPEKGDGRDAERYPHAAIGAALISTGLYDRMNDITGGDREARYLIEELISKVDPIFDKWHSAALSQKAGE